MKINTRGLAYIFIMLSCVRLEAFVTIPFIDIIYDVLKLVGFFLALSMMLLSIAGKYQLKFNRFHMTFIGWMFITFISVVISNTSIAIYVIKYLPFFSIILLMEYVIRRDDINYFLNVISKYFALLICANFILICIFHNGIVQEIRLRPGMLYPEAIGIHLIGKANAIGPTLLVMSILVLINDYINNKNKINFLVPILGFISIIIIGSSTAIIGLFVYFIIYALYLFKQNYNNRKCINFHIFFVISIMLSIGFVIFNIQYYFDSLLYFLFKKDVTLSNRTNVWTILLNHFNISFSCKEYLLGTGLMTYRNEIFNGRYAHCHNHFFDIFIQSGIIGLFFYIKMFWLSLNNIIFCYNKKYRNIIIVLGSTIISFTIMFIAEVYITPLILLVLCIAYNICAFEIKK